MRTLRYLILTLAVGMLLGAPSAYASTILIDFSTGTAGGGGTITVSGGNAIGSGILIDFLNVTGAPVSGGFNVNGLGPTTSGSFGSTGILSFNTALNFIRIDGSIPSLGIGQSQLLNGSFSSFTITQSGLVRAVSGIGPDSKSPALLLALGLPANTPFNFFGFTISAKNTRGSYVTYSTDILNSATVPEPSSFLLLGIGILGLSGAFILKPQAINH